MSTLRDVMPETPETKPQKSYTWIIVLSLVCGGFFGLWMENLFAMGFMIFVGFYVGALAHEFLTK